VIINSAKGFNLTLDKYGKNASLYFKEK